MVVRSQEQGVRSQEKEVSRRVAAGPATRFKGKEEAQDAHGVDEWAVHEVHAAFVEESHDGVGQGEGDVEDDDEDEDAEDDDDEAEGVGAGELHEDDGEADGAGKNAGDEFDAEEVFG